MSEHVMPLPPSVPRSQRGGGSGGMRAMQYKQATDASRQPSARVPPALAAHKNVRAFDAEDRNQENKENRDVQRISVKVLGHKDAVGRNPQAAAGDDLLMRVQSLPLNAHAAEGERSAQHCSARPAAGRPVSSSVNRCWPSRERAGNRLSKAALDARTSERRGFPHALPVAAPLHPGVAAARCILRQVASLGA